MCFNHSKINGIMSSEITKRKTNGVGFHSDVESKKRNEQTEQKQKQTFKYREESGGCQRGGMRGVQIGEASGGCKLPGRK